MVAKDPMNIEVPQLGREAPPPALLRRREITMDQVNGGLRQLERRVDRLKPSLWSKLRTPLIVGGIALGGWLLFPYLANYLKNWNKDLAAKTAENLENTRKARGALGGAPVINKDYTAKTNDNTGGGGAADPKTDRDFDD